MIQALSLAFWARMELSGVKCLTGRARCCPYVGLCHTWVLLDIDIRTCLGWRR